MVLWMSVISCILLCSPDSAIPEWQRPGRCATNCLYVYLKICGHPVSSYDDVAAAVPVKEKRGTSLSDLAKAANQLGATVTPLRVEDSEFQRIPLPFIAHLDLLDRGGAGHFITVFKIESDGTVRYIDGSSGLQTACNINELRPVLTGFVLTKSAESLAPRSALPIVIGGLSFGLLVGALTVKGRGA
jgi:ABC-type bacteriocin/lantibiotic exporter with double-glycine peptidase domain